MQMLASLFIGKPIHILLIAIVLWASHVLMRRQQSHLARKRHPLLIAATGWALYAGWEWWMNTSTPEADIRVDLLLIWPILALFTLWAMVASFRHGA